MVFFLDVIRPSLLCFNVSSAACFFSIKPVSPSCYKDTNRDLQIRRRDLKKLIDISSSFSPVRKNRHIGKLHCTFFTRNVSTVITGLQGTPSLNSAPFGRLRNIWALLHTGTLYLFSQFTQSLALRVSTKHFFPFQPSVANLSSSYPSKNDWKVGWTPREIGLGSSYPSSSYRGSCVLLFPMKKVGGQVHGRRGKSPAPEYIMQKQCEYKLFDWLGNVRSPYFYGCCGVQSAWRRINDTNTVALQV